MWCESSPLPVFAPTPRPRSCRGSATATPAVLAHADQAALGGPIQLGAGLGGVGVELGDVAQLEG